VVIYDVHPSGKIVVLSQCPTRIPDVEPRPSFARHRRGMSPDAEARLLARYIYRKSEEGKVGYRRFDEIEV